MPERLKKVIEEYRLSINATTMLRMIKKEGVEDVCIV